MAKMLYRPRAIMESRTVFISSTTDDLFQYRSEAVRVLNKLNEDFKGKFQLVEKHMGNQGQSGERESPREASERWVSESDWVVLIVAFHYGFVPPGNDRSVTEYEYRYAREGCDPPKSCFVFIAGGQNDNPAYRHRSNTAGRESDLAKWKTLPDDFSERTRAEQEEFLRKQGLLTQFKKLLRDNKTYELFSDIDDFSSKLEVSLKKRIELELRPLDSPDVVIRDLILAQRQRLRACFSAIRLLATLKKVHDHLHRIRQHGIIRWQKEVLAVWKSGPMQSETKETFIEVRGIIRENIAALKVLVDGLPEGQVTGPAEKLKKVIEVALPNRDNVAAMAPSDFERSVNNLASLVQRVFSDVEDSMTGQRIALRREFNGLNDDLRIALSFSGLTKSQHQALNERLRVIEHRIDDLDRVLETHRRWQRIHDQLDALAKTTQEDLRAEFSTFLEVCRSDLRKLLEMAKSEPPAISPTLLSAQGEDITAALDRTEADGLESAQAEEVFAQLREPFDILFFDVDSSTREFVTRSEERVKSYEESLRALEVQLRSKRTPAMDSQVP